jgi:hypothetical protein
LSPDSVIRKFRITAADGKSYETQHYNLDVKNPRAKEDITHLPPTQLAADILKKEQRIAEIMGSIQKLLAKKDQ